MERTRKYVRGKITHKRGHFRAGKWERNNLRRIVS